MKTFYASTFIDESRTYPNKKDISQPTGNLRGFVMTRTFYRTKAGKLVQRRGMIPFAWEQENDESKGIALSKILEGMEEMTELDANPPLNFVPPKKYNL